MNLFSKGMQKLKDLLERGSKEDMRTRSGSNTSAESFANNVCTGGGGVKVVTDPKGFLAVPGILMPYPCSHFYFDIKFGDRLYSKEKR